MSKLTALPRLLGPVLRPPGNAAGFSSDDWQVVRSDDRSRVTGRVRVANIAGDREVMLTGVEPRVTVLADGPVDGIRVDARARSLEADYPPRPDGYWTAFVVKPHKDARFEVTVELSGSGVDAAYALWVDVRMATYGGEGPRVQSHHVVLPLRERDGGNAPAWRDVAAGVSVLPVRTHLLTPQDDPVAVVKQYVAPHARPGDIVTIGESPLAIMQGRFRHPSEIRPGLVARKLCYMLGGEGSLGTAPGLQALIDQVGTARVLTALTKGIIGKLQGRDGDFYRTAGEEAKLIDDVTGTLPPYDQFLVLGPVDGDRVVRDIASATGLEAAVVDANDLGAVDVLAATAGASIELIGSALRSNPAGNGAERTPLVLIRRTPQE
jgi:hypothetical protein